MPRGGNLILINDLTENMSHKRHTPLVKLTKVIKTQLQTKTLLTKKKTTLLTGSKKPNNHKIKRRTDWDQSSSFYSI